MFINGLFYGVMSLVLIGVGFLLGSKKSDEERRETYCRGYDYAVADMKNLGYYYDKNRHRHTGEWIEKEEENV